MAQQPNKENLLGSGFVKQVVEDAANVNGAPNPTIHIMVRESSNRTLLCVGCVYTVNTATVNDGKNKLVDLEAEQEVYFRAKADVNRDPSGPGKTALIRYIWTYPKLEYFGDDTDYAVVRRVEMNSCQCWAVFRRNVVVPMAITRQFLKNYNVVPLTRLKLTYNPFPTDKLVEVSLFQKEDCEDIYCDEGMITRYNATKNDGFIVGRELGSIFVYEAALSYELQRNQRSLEGIYVSAVCVFDKRASGDRQVARFKAFQINKLGDEPPLEYYARCNFRVPLAEKCHPDYVGQGILVGFIGETAELAFKYGKAVFTKSLIASLKDESGMPLIPSSAPLSTLIGSKLWFKTKTQSQNKTESEWSCSGIGLRKEDLIF